METLFKSAGLAAKYKEPKEFKPTRFTHFVSKKHGIVDCSKVPTDFDEVYHIGIDPNYKDVFQCYTKGKVGFAIYFGIKGDESYK